MESNQPLPTHSSFSTWIVVWMVSLLVIITYTLLVISMHDYYLQGQQKSSSNVPIKQTILSGTIETAEKIPTGSATLITIHPLRNKNLKDTTITFASSTQTTWKFTQAQENQQYAIEAFVRDKNSEYAKSQKVLVTAPSENIVLFLTPTITPLPSQKELPKTIRPTQIISPSPLQ